MAALSIEGKIFEALATVLASLSWVKTVEYENLRVLPSEWRDFELPSLQFFDNRAIVTHARGDVDVQWSISIELTLKSTADATYSQIDLFDKKQEIETLIGANVDLGISGMKHLKFDGWETDATEMPYLICRIDFTALYKKSFTGC
jgi:hypothetical protein